MYNPSKMFTINIFKELEPWSYLEQFNSVVIESCKEAQYDSENNYDTTKGQASNWFKPEEIKRTPFYPENPYYPSPHPVQLEKKFNLIMHSANYVSLFLVNALYQDRKDILIEDICCGMSQFSFYLSKLGFKNFILIDNFSQVPEKTLTSFMGKADVKYITNSFASPSVVSNLVAYPVYLKRKRGDQIYGYDKLEPPPDNMYISPTIELFLSYYPITETRGLSGLDNKKFLHEERFVPLCEDTDHMLFAYVRSEMYDEFKEKLKYWALPDWGHRDLDRKLAQ